jgi:hypothetical protein
MNSLASDLCLLTSAPDAATAATGWGHTRGWSKKLHYFEERRAHCSGSTQRDNESLIPSVEILANSAPALTPDRGSKPPLTSAERWIAAAVGDPICVDCLNYATGNQRDNHQRGIARSNYNSRTRKISRR